MYKYKSHITLIDLKIAQLLCITVALLITILWAGGCSDTPFASTQTEGTAPSAALGFKPVAVTFRAIGTDSMSASVKPAVPPIAYSLTKLSGSAGPNDGTIQLKSLSNGSFTYGERGNGGVRYLYATFAVRNANIDGNPYPSPRENLTFMAVDNANTYGLTAVSGLRLFDGTLLSGPAAQTIAEKVIPTGRVEATGNGVFIPVVTDVLQVFYELFLTNIFPPAGVEVFPYGFVTRSPGTVTPGSRDIPANPPPNGYYGKVTFAFKILLQDTPAQDPFEVTMLFLPVDETASPPTLTQPIELQTDEGDRLIAERAAELDARYVTIFPGSFYQGVFDFRCYPVRVAGSDNTNILITRLFPNGGGVAGVTQRTPDPYSSGQNSITSPASFSIDHSPAISDFDPRMFVVHGSQTGQHFIGQPYTVSGATITTPSEPFFPGEMVEVSLTPALGSCAADAHRYRVATTAGNGTFTLKSGPQGITSISSAAIGDVNGDGNLDIITSNSVPSPHIKTFIGDGNGNYGPAAGTFNLLGHPYDVKLGDLDGDGDLDVVTANKDDSNVSILLGDGAGNFNEAPGSPYATGIWPVDAELGDINGDGALDIVTNNVSSGDFSLFMGNGKGHFKESMFSPYHIGTTVASLTLADMNENGNLDIIYTTPSTDAVFTLFWNPSELFDISQPNSSAANVGDLPQSVAVGDMDNDGDLDIVVDISSSSPSSIQIVEGMGNGTFGLVNTFIAAGTGMDNKVKLGDVNADGNLDVVITSANLDLASVLLGNGDLTLGSPVNYTVGNLPKSIDLGDVNNDGALDFATADNADGIVTLYLGQ